MTNKDLHAGQEIVFADGKKRVIKPLTIRQLRKFMKVANQLQVRTDSEMTDEDIAAVVKACKVILC